MAKKKRKSSSIKRKKKSSIKTEDTATALGIVFLFLSALSLVSFILPSTGLMGFRESVGYGAPIAALLFLAIALRMFGTKIKYNTAKVIVGLFVFLLSFITFISLFVSPENASQIAQEGKMGGVIGYHLSQDLADTFSPIGAMVILFPILIISFFMSLSIPLIKVLRFVRTGFTTFTNVFTKNIIPFFEELFAKSEVKQKDLQVAGTNNESVSSKEPQWQGGLLDKLQEAPKLVGDLSGKNIIVKDVPSQEGLPVPLPHQAVTAVDEFNQWMYPPITLFNEVKAKPQVNENIKKNADIIEKTLDSFGILAKVADVSVGPSVTQYALQITMGTKVAKIHNLSKDLALALAAPSGQVRIEAPIPGTSLVGIEVPNTNPRPVMIREVLESAEIPNQKLALAFGRDVTGKVIIKDLQKMPHLLIAGATGSGKSVTVNSFIISLLYTHSPNELKFIMVDPKQVELSGYNGIPHLLTPVITDVEKVTNALKFVIVEMENRYKMFKTSNVRNIESYNQLENITHIPYLVLIIDEMADLMLQKGIEIENSIVRLAQMARATGIHLILATQRPSVDVITGLIKANIPARIALAVTSAIDSRVIIDQTGAESLVGKGDMLFKQPDTGRPMRVQAAWTSDEEVNSVVEFIKKQSGEVEYNEEVTNSINNSSSSGSSGVIFNDNMFPDAVKVVVNAKRGSASILQSKLRIGYARAARLIEELEEKGVVGPADGSKPRDVLVTDASSFLGEVDTGEENE